MTFTADELADMQATQEDYLPETCLVKRRADIPDGQGGYLAGYTDAATTTARLAPMKQEQVAQFASKLAGRSGWVVTLAHDVTVAVGDRLTIDSVDYEVIGTQDVESWITALRVYCGLVR